MTVSAIKSTIGRQRRTALQDAPDPVDVHVGGRVKLRRVMMGLTMQQMGDRLGVSFQQVQKYERGANRLAASTLHRIAQLLDVPVSFFFDDMPAEPGGGAPAGRGIHLPRRDGFGLVENYGSIPERVRRPLGALIKAIAQQATDVRRVLVAEDDPLLGPGIKHMLASAGYEIVGPVADLAAVLAVATGERLDAAVLDVHLGRDRVFPAAELLAGRAVPIVFSSGAAADEIPPGLRRFPLLRKPYAPADLLAAVDLAVRLTPCR